jgi:YfiH family protein
VNPSEPFLLRPFPEWESRVRAAFTTRSRQGRLPVPNPDPYADFNLGFRSGDRPESPARNWGLALAAAGLAGKPLALPKMIHGDVMADADRAPIAVAFPLTGDVQPVLEPEGADALCASTPRYALAVTMADCLTALVFDPACGTIAAVHAGWRGSRARILEKSLRSLADQGRIRTESTLVAFGPCLRPASLEVGEAVAETLPPENVIRKDGKWFFDMPECNRTQALASGILPGHIRDLGGDTLREPERYFSYRRDGKASGRLAAFISLM